MAESAARKEASVSYSKDCVVKRRDYLIKRQKELGLTNFQAADLLDFHLGIMRDSLTE